MFATILKKIWNIKTVTEPKPFNVDFDFLHKLEGFEIKGYVPKDLDPNDKTPSGVTIAAGYDLGQQGALQVYSTLKDADALALYTKLQVYIGLKGKEARDILKKYPLLLSKEEANLLDKAVKQVYLQDCEEEYNYAKPKTKFRDLTPAQQTVIFSVFYQYGSLRRRTPNFYKVITSGDWDRAVWHLNNFGDGYKTRRKQEAAYLQASMK